MKLTIFPAIFASFFPSRTEKLLIYLEIFQALSFLWKCSYAMLLSNMFLLKCVLFHWKSIWLSNMFCQSVLCVHTYMLYMNYIYISIGICQAYFKFLTLLFICFLHEHFFFLTFMQDFIKLKSKFVRTNLTNFSLWIQVYLN